MPIFPCGIENWNKIILIFFKVLLSRLEMPVSWQHYTSVAYKIFSDLILKWKKQTSCFFPFFSPCDKCNFKFRVPFQGLRLRNRTTFGWEAQPWNRLASLASVPEQSVVGHSLTAGEHWLCGICRVHQGSAYCVIGEYGFWHSWKRSISPRWE